ncbi:MAG: hypothetical protein FWD68_07360 [Alphaproteobacteria bacterium]|nr:hypothetical protein [Alphaproteobacteria bacterium]
MKHMLFGKPAATAMDAVQATRNWKRSRLQGTACPQAEGQERLAERPGTADPCGSFQLRSVGHGWQIGNEKDEDGHGVAVDTRQSLIIAPFAANRS